MKSPPLYTKKLNNRGQRSFLKTEKANIKYTPTALNIICHDDVEEEEKHKCYVDNQAYASELAGKLLKIQIPRLQPGKYLFQQGKD